MFPPGYCTRHLTMRFRTESHNQRGCNSHLRFPMPAAVHGAPESATMDKLCARKNQKTSMRPAQPVPFANRLPRRWANAGTARAAGAVAEFNSARIAKPNARRGNTPTWQIGTQYLRERPRSNKPAVEAPRGRSADTEEEIT